MILYNTNHKTDLCYLFEKYGADKCPSIRHSYSPIYHQLLCGYQNLSLNILEIGIGNAALMKPIVGDAYVLGASLKAWRDYFFNSQIYGIDIEGSSLFVEERIKTYLVNQVSQKEIDDFIATIILETNNPLFKFNIIIDDGSHVISDMACSLKFFYNYLDHQGLYIIEDINKYYLDELLDHDYLKNNFNISYFHQGPLEDDCFIVAKKKLI
jgi:hypothetical protein